eukprot:COSAG01_NODE_1040_length_11961_cov_22.590794_12_plen_61_part_00
MTTACVGLREFVTMWESLTGEKIDDVIRIAEAEIARLRGLKPGEQRICTRSVTKSVICTA